ncbi:MAG: DUF3048 domain-containing protein [Acetatifactor sp.]|nr:DUF3048 domain-containing protein [Acetatifactor sp.]
MKKRILAAIIIAMGILVGCGDNTPVNSPAQVTPLPDGSGGSADNVTSEADPTEEPMAENGKLANGEKHPITERTEVNGQMQSYLTGEWKDADVVQRRSMAVMIPNNQIKSATVPQHGISQASIIYEAPVEGRITRLMAIFEDYDNLELIGPIRSSRDYYVYEAMAYDSIYCNWGLAVPYVADVINSDRIDNVSQSLEGITKGAPEAFGRGLNDGYAQEFTSSMNIEGYEKAVARLKYATTYEAHGRFQQAFTFADEGYIATYEGYPEATVVYPGGNTSNRSGYGNSGNNPIKFEYNEEDGLYYRYQYGEAQVDADNGEQLAVANVVFKICHGEVRDNHDYLAFRVHGTGKAYVFTNGKVIEGTWKRNSDYEANIFYDNNGNEIVFNQGKTWICCIWEEYSEYIDWE